MINACRLDKFRSITFMRDKLALIVDLKVKMVYYSICRIMDKCSIFIQNRGEYKFNG